MLLGALEGSTVSRATASPLFTQVTDIVSTAVNDVQQLVGAPVGTVLASVDGTVTVAVSDVAVLASKALSVRILPYIYYDRNQPLIRPP